MAYNYSSLVGAGDEFYNDAALDGAGDFSFGEAYNDAALAGAGDFSFGEAYNDAALAGAGYCGGFALPKGNPGEWAHKSEKTMRSRGKAIKNRIYKLLSTAAKKRLNILQQSVGIPDLDIAFYFAYIADSLRVLILKTPKTSRAKLRKYRAALAECMNMVSDYGVQRAFDYVHQLVRKTPDSRGTLANQYLLSPTTEWRRTPMLRGLDRIRASDYMRYYQKKAKN